MEISHSVLSQITRAFIWLDAMFYKVRHEGRVQSRALHNILGINKDGHGKSFIPPMQWRAIIGKSER